MDMIGEKDGYFVCMACTTYKALTKSKVKRHVSMVHCAGSEVPCPICGKSYKNQISMKQHQRSSKECKSQYVINSWINEEWSWQLGNYALLVWSILSEKHCTASLLVHKNSAGKIVDFLTELRTKFLLLDIEEFITEDGKKNYMCVKCGYFPAKAPAIPSDAKRRIRRHLESVHSGPKNLFCPTCEKTFKNRDSLRVHSKREHGISLSRAQIPD